MLLVKDLCFSYGRKPILSGVSLTVKPGECAAVTGPNGSGKTTLLELIAGVLRPASGTLERPGRVGYAPQTPALFSEMTVLENLTFFSGLAGARKPATDLLGLTPLLPERVSRLSGGTKKRVGLACALQGEPELLLLDEPWASLDETLAQELTERILSRKADGCAVVCTSHSPERLKAVADVSLALEPMKLEAAHPSANM